MLGYEEGGRVLARRPAQSGATLIELMVGVAIFGVLLAMSASTFRTWLANSQIRNAAEALQNGLQVARAEALKRNGNVEFRLLVGSNGLLGPGWTVVTVTTNETIQTRVAEEGSSKAVVTVTPANATKLTFTPLGQVLGLNVDGTMPFTRLDVDLPSSVLAASETRELRILAARSQIRMCDPNVSDTNDPRHC